MELFLAIISAFIFAFYGYLCECIMTSQKIKFDKNVLLAFLIFSFLFYLITFVMSPTYTTFFLCFMYIPLLQFIFKGDMLETAISSVMFYSFRLFFKLLYLFISRDTWDVICGFRDYSMTKFIINTMSIILALLTIYMHRRVLRRVKDKLMKNNYKDKIFLGIFSVDLIVVLLIRYPYMGDAKLSVLADSVVLAIIAILYFYLLDSNNKANNMEAIYKQLFEYSKLNEELNLGYRMRVHENKNKLLLIKSMINEDNKEANEFIDSLLDEYNNDILNYWLSDLSHIPIPGVRNFINHKLVEMKKLGAVIEVYVSNELSSIDPSTFDSKKYNDLSTMLGIVLDNMIEALDKQKDKLVSINIYLEDNKIIGEFANSYEGKIDLEKIYTKGYTTKGGQHGVGLPLLKSISENSNVLDCKTRLMDNFFIQDVIIKLEDPNNLTENL